MTSADATGLTRRQVGVLRLRADGHTHAEIATELDASDGTEATSAEDVREIERAAKATVERARRTLDFVASIRRGPTTITVASGTTLEELTDRIYARGDDSGIKVGYCHTDLETHLRDALEDRIEDDRACAPATLTLTEEGDVTPEGRG